MAAGDKSSEWVQDVKGNPGINMKQGKKTADSSGIPCPLGGRCIDLKRVSERARLMLLNKA